MLLPPRPCVPVILIPLITRPRLEKQRAKNSILLRSCRNKNLPPRSGAEAAWSFPIHWRFANACRLFLLTTLDEIRQNLIQKHLVDIASPMTTELFIRLVAEASREEELETGVCPTPYWRTLKPKGKLNPKVPGGIPTQRALLQKEGHQLIHRGKRDFVGNFAQVLDKLQSP